MSSCATFSPFPTSRSARRWRQRSVHGVPAGGVLRSRLPSSTLPRCQSGTRLRGELLVGEPPARDRIQSVYEAFATRLLASIEPECLLVEVAEEVERLDAHIRPPDGPLEEPPEIFHAVHMDVAVHVLNRVVYDFVCVVGLA